MNEQVTVTFEDKETLEWIMRNLVESFIYTYDKDSPAVDRAIGYYDNTMKQIGGDSYKEKYEGEQL